MTELDELMKFYIEVYGPYLNSTNISLARTVMNEAVIIDAIRAFRQWKEWQQTGPSR